MADRRAQRQGFLISALAHLVVLTALLAHAQLDARLVGPVAVPPPAARESVFLPSPEQLRRLLPNRSPVAHVARPTPPPPSSSKDRISVGPASLERSRGPLVLRREVDLTAVPKGTEAAPAPPPAASAIGPSPPASAARTAEARAITRAPGLALPPGLGRLLRDERGPAGREGGPRASIASSARENVDRGFGNGSFRGLPSGAGRQMGPLFFDPAGADFTEWINHFKNEVYRNWIVPQAALLGYTGDVDIAFVVARDGTLVELTLLRSSGTAALDRAARNAIEGSRLLPLPEDYRPSETTMRVRFIYG